MHASTASLGNLIFFFCLKSGTTVSRNSVDQYAHSRKEPCSPDKISCNDNTHDDLGTTTDASQLNSDDDCNLFEQSMSKFAEDIAKKGWVIRGETPADGNCCFHAISDQLKKVQSSQKIGHCELRSKVVKFFDNLSQVSIRIMISISRN